MDYITGCYLIALCYDQRDKSRDEEIAAVQSRVSSIPPVVHLKSTPL